MLAAEATAAALAEGRSGDELTAYPEAFRASWLFDELERARNFKPLMAKGLWKGSLLFGIDQQVFRGKAPWTLRLGADHAKLKPAAQCAPIDYPKPDGVLTFDRLSSVYLSNTNHEEDQPCHLTLKDPTVPIRINLAPEVDLPAALALLTQAHERGADPHNILADMLEQVHSLTRFAAIPALARDPALPENERVRGAALAAALSVPMLARAWQMLL